MKAEFPFRYIALVIGAVYKSDNPPTSESDHTSLAVMGLVDDQIDHDEPLMTWQHVAYWPAKKIWTRTAWNHAKKEHEDQEVKPVYWTELPDANYADPDEPESEAPIRFANTHNWQTDLLKSACCVWLPTEDL